MSFSRQLLLDISSSEDVDQVHPLLLAEDPLLHDRRKNHQILLPLFSDSSQWFHISATKDHVDGGEALVEGLIEDVNVRYDESVALSVSDDCELDLLPCLVEHLDHCAQGLLLRSLCRDGCDVLLELHCIQVDQRLQGELGVSDVEVTVYQVLDFFPMVLLQGLVTEGYHNRHRSLESIDHIFKLSLNGIILEVLLKSKAYLGIVVGLSRDFFSLNIVELSLDPDLLQLLPLLERAPHHAAEVEVFSQRVELLENGRVSLQHLLVLVVLRRQLLHILKSCLFFVQNLQNFEHIRLA